jgi:transposase
MKRLRTELKVDGGFSAKRCHGKVVGVNSIATNQEGLTMKRAIIGLDIAKLVFQAHWIDETTGELHRDKLKRAKVSEYFAQLPRSVVVMEACGSAHHWARKLIAQGHEVKLIAGQFVKPYLKSNKTDLADAEAIHEAAQRPGMRFVAPKSQAQQSVLALHRVRQQLVKFRTMHVNQVRAILYEFGEVISKGRLKAMKELPAAYARLEETLPAFLLDTLRDQIQRLAGLDKEIEAIEMRLAVWKKSDDKTRRVAEIPGVGLLTATALVATMGEASAFKNGREFAAYLGLVPRQTGTGGKVRLQGISKRGDVYLRTLLIHGARAVAFHTKTRPSRLTELLKRRPLNVAIVAWANCAKRLRVWDSPARVSAIAAA